MMRVSYVSTSATATVVVAVSFFPSDREIEMNMFRRRPRTGSGAPRTIWGLEPSVKSPNAKRRFCNLLILLGLLAVLEVAAVRDDGREGHAVGNHRQNYRSEGGAEDVSPRERGQGMKERLGVGPRKGGDCLTEFLEQARPNLHPEDARAEHRRERVIRRQDPWQVGVDPHQHGHA